ncbi:MAG TPA: MATE family efflux transporter [Gemmatimonadaceae bacterium]|nr:MATE family efflux transporter [Gemmatimonadaceae bacterium]
MQDLTTGPVSRHLLKTTSFMLVTMIFQTLYYLIDLYWVGRLGTQAVAAVGIAGNLTFIVLALSQMLGVGTTAVVSHAVGRKDQPQALLLFNQSQVLSMVTGLVFLVVGMAARWPYSRAMSADEATASQAAQYLLWFIPAMALQFFMVAMGAGLRAVGNFKTGMVVGTATVILNMVLAPFLIFGWVTGRAFGVAGAAISTLIAVVVGVVWLAAYFVKKDAYLRFVSADWKPRFDLWRKVLAIGLPTGFEFAITALYLAVVYTITRPFGASAQAAFGIGMRVIQAGFMPVVALGFAVAPVAGQNFGARKADRVKATYKDAAWMGAGVMLLFAIACHLAPTALIGIFSKDASVISIGEEYLRIVSWNYVASGLIFVNSSMFQAMGNTIPSLVSSGVRIILLSIPALWLSRLPSFQLHWIWYLSVTTVVVQWAISTWYLRREFNRRLNWDAPAAAPGLALAEP